MDTETNCTKIKADDWDDTLRVIVYDNGEVYIEIAGAVGWPGAWSGTLILSNDNRKALRKALKR